MTKKRLLTVSLLLLLLLLGIVFYQYARFFDGKLHVVFCDVGQGDAIFIRTPKGLDVLVDGGPGDRVLSCLANHMPFWDRTLTFVFLTHPHLDHFEGLMPVLARYTVLSFNTERLSNKSASFVALRKLLEQKTKTRNLYAGDTFRTKEDLRIHVLWPTKEVLAQSPEGVIGNSGEFASLILHMSFAEFDLLLTGDSQKEALSQAISRLGNASLEVLHVPHHGSKSGIDRELLAQVSPKLAVISVGKNNRYGHPHEEVIRALADQKIRTLRTDQHGEVEIVSDGKMWYVD